MYSTTRQIRCSQCHGVGHNKRNPNCSVNRSIRATAELQQLQASQSLNHYYNAVDGILLMTNLIQKNRLCFRNIILPFMDEVAQVRENIEYCDSPDYIDVIRKMLVQIERVANDISHIGIEFNVDVLISGLNTHVVLVNDIISRVCYVTSVLPSNRHRAHIMLYSVHIYYEERIVLFPCFQSATVTAEGIQPEGNSIKLSDIPLFTHNYITMLLTPTLYVTIECIDYLKKLNIVNNPTDQTTPQQCSICFDEIDANMILRTNCKHAFCADCMIPYTDSIKQKPDKPTCPCCRTEITELTSGNAIIRLRMHEHLFSL